MPGSGLKVYVVVGGGGGGVRTKFSVQLWSQAEQQKSNGQLSKETDVQGTFLQ